MPQRALIELFHGKGAHVDPIACVDDIPAGLAARRINGFPHSIADLVFHMNYWMTYELHRIRGDKPKYPEHNAESFPRAMDPEQWTALRQEFARLIAEFAGLAEFPRAELDRQVEPAHDGDKNVAGTVEAILWQMVAHNSYHTGQIAMIRRALGAWPPKAGGDTW